MTTDTTPSDRTTAEAPPARSWSRLELALGAVVVVVAVALTARWARSTWFTHDEWEYILGRTAFDLDSLLRPFGGHWTSWSTLLLRGLFGGVGLDYWPWYYVPRLVGHTLLAVAIWRVARYRGADPVVAFLAFTALLLLDASFYQRALQVGNWVVYGAMILCALTITRRPDEPTRADRLIVGVALFAAALGNGYAVAVIGGIIVVLVLTRRIVTWIPSLLPVTVAYGLWYLHYRGDLRRRPETISAVLDMPLGIFRLLRTATESSTGLPGWLAAIAVVGLVTWIVALAISRRFDLFDGIVLSTLIVGLVLLNLQRIAYEPEAASRERYSYSLIVLLTLLLLPHVPRPKTVLATAAAVLVGAGVVYANASGLHGALGERDAGGARSLIRAAAAFELIDAGEPIVATVPAVLPGLDTDEIRRLQADGHTLEPLAASHRFRDFALADARGALRMDMITNTPVDEVRDTFAEGAAPTTDATLDTDGCVVVSPADPVDAVVTAPALLTVAKEERDQALILTWTDDYGTGRQVISGFVLRAVVALAEPEGSATLSLATKVGEIVVCGFEPAEDPGPGPG